MKSLVREPISMVRKMLTDESDEVKTLVYQRELTARM